MQPEGGVAAAVGLPAAGVVLASALRGRPRFAFGLAFALGLAGLAALLAGKPAIGLGLGPQGGLPPAARVLLAVSAAEVGLIVVLAPVRVDRLALLGAGLAAIAALSLAGAAPDPILLAVVLLGLGVGQSLLPGLRPFPTRLRGPALAAVLLATGTVLLRSGAPGAAPRLGAMLLAVGIAAAAGLAPFLQELEATEPVPASALAWTGFLAPILALSLVGRAEVLLPVGAASVFGAVLIGLGLLNLFAGLLGAWAARDDAAAWRDSFLADWGLALVGLGILLPDGAQAAYLLLLSIVAIRLPLYIAARPVLRGAEPRRMTGANLLLTGLLVGMAPFAGFAARLLLLRGATQIYWPLGVVLAVAMLFWLGHGFRLAATIGRPRGRGAVAVGIACLLSVAIGVYPAPWLALGGF